MSSAQIREAVEKASRKFLEQPDKAKAKNPPATAVIEDSLKCRVTGPAGELLRTDMPLGVGGGADAPTPGWVMRAALASCSATCIAMQAALRGIELARLEVSVSSETDNRGLLALDEGVSAGMRALRLEVRISAPGRSAEELADLVQWANRHSPVGCTDLPSLQVDIQVE